MAAPNFFDQFDSPSTGGTAPVVVGGMPSIPLGADPARQLDRVLKQQQIEANNRDIGQSGLDAQIKQQQIVNAQLEEEKKRRDLIGGPTANPETIGAAQAKIAAARQLQDQLSTVERMFTERFEGRRSLGEYLPTAPNSEFDAAVGGLMPLIRQAFRVPGSGSDTEKEAQYLENLIPNRWSYDESNRQRIDQLKDMIGSVEREYAPIAGERRRDDPAVVGGPVSPVGGGRAGGGTPMGLASGGTREEVDVALSGQVDRMIREGATADEINAILPPGARQVSQGEVDTRQRYLRANPNYGGSMGRVTRTVANPILSQMAASPVGAYFASAADAVVPLRAMGVEGQDIEALEAANPTASLLGMLSGGMMGAAGAEFGLARAGLSGLAATRGGDALYGAIQGAGNADAGQGVMGGVTGALAGLGGGMAGRAVARGAGNFAQGVSDPSVQFLRQQSIPTTVGQTVGNSGLWGGMVKGAEDRLAGAPFLGDVVNARRTEGLEAFNRAAFQQAAAPGGAVTAYGAPGMQQVRQSVQDAYSRALDPVDLDIAGDPRALLDITNAQLAAGNIPQGVGQNAMEAIDYRIGGGLSSEGRMGGRDFQEAYRGLGRDRRTAPDPYAAEFGGAMRQGQEALADALQRQQPGQFPQFIEANAANRRAEVLAKALGNGGNQADELVTPAQLNRADIQSTSRLEGAVQSASGNRPFYDLATAGQAVLPSKVPDSGTAGRLAMLALPGALGGAGAGADALGIGGGSGGQTGLGLGALMALGGTRQGQRILSSLLADRPDWLRRMGVQVNNRAALGGVIGAPLLVAAAQP